jgi:hypothetical protein
MVQFILNLKIFRIRTRVFGASPIDQAPMQWRNFCSVINDHSGDLDDEAMHRHDGLCLAGLAGHTR